MAKKRNRRVSDLLKRGDPLICYWCQEPVTKVPPNHPAPQELGPYTATVDHVHPIKSGGMDRLFNCVISCRGCNEVRDKHLSACDYWQLEFRKSIATQESQFLEKYHAKVRELLNNFSDKVSYYNGNTEQGCNPFSRYFKIADLENNRLPSEQKTGR